MEGFGIYSYAPEEDSEEEDTEQAAKNSYFEGVFEDGRRTKGTMYYSSGDVFDGIFDE